MCGFEWKKKRIPKKKTRNKRRRRRRDTWTRSVRNISKNNMFPQKDHWIHFFIWKCVISLISVVTCAILNPKKWIKLKQKTNENYYGLDAYTQTSTRMVKSTHTAHFIQREQFCTLSYDTQVPLKMKRFSVGKRSISIAMFVSKPLRRQKKTSFWFS